jgi:nucleotide-binding universal stress UspA family protein
VSAGVTRQIGRISVRHKALGVVVATDGSSAGRAAIAAAVAFPWPAGSRVLGVVARGGWARVSTPTVALVLGEAVGRIARSARRMLARRWPAAEVVIVDRPPVEAILAEARRFRAAVIVMGWRGHGGFSRLMMGSVSRGVLRRAPCPVLVVRRRPGRVSRFVVGFDGSANARRGHAFLARLAPPRGGRVVLAHVLEPMPVPSSAWLSQSTRRAARSEVAALNAKRRAQAERELEKGAEALRRAGWRVRTTVRIGVPLAELLATVRDTRAHVLVVGARGVGGVERLLLGSVAEGVLTWSSVPVLISR